MSAPTLAPAQNAATPPDAPAPEPTGPPEDRAPAFTLGAARYTFPAHIPVGWGLTYLRLFYASSEDHALVWALRQLLGAEQVVALEVDPNLTRETLQTVVEACRQALMGAFEDPKGSSPNG